MTIPKKVMIIDDEPDVVAAIQNSLKNNGYKANGFTDSRKALEEFRNNSQEYALIISDIRMPGMSGFDLARRAKGTRPDVPIVLMSAFEINKPEFSSLFPSMSVSELVTKPMTKALLLAMVRKYVGITELH
ncbi:MAG: response regulator [Nitrososphaera sp.]|uniref:Putative signal transduction response regulator n=1 Tax=Nitrososphaera gargensis (strain Ga9.2) TaxID=1237085 RepID=K0IHF6_NITGG|nr:response regulator [Candidatus Nitrososphaera gargensis]AFU57222.1 putative signal transduction response regulator [Candidatus Nitrososphaera gargensis Ga9.2]